MHAVMHFASLACMRVAASASAGQLVLLRLCVCVCVLLQSASMVEVSPEEFEAAQPDVLRDSATELVGLWNEVRHHVCVRVCGRWWKLYPFQEDLSMPALEEGCVCEKSFKCICLLRAEVLATAHFT